MLFTCGVDAFLAGGLRNRFAGFLGRSKRRRSTRRSSEDMRQLVAQRNALLEKSKRDVHSLRKRLKYHQTRCHTLAARVKERRSQFSEAVLWHWSGIVAALAQDCQLRLWLVASIKATLLRSQSIPSSHLNIVQQPRNKCEPSGHLADAVKDGKFDIATVVVPSICTACD